MDNKIIQFLKIIQEGRDRHGSIFCTIPEELPEGYNMSNVKYYQKLKLIGDEGNILHLTPLGYQTLNSHYSLELSKDSSKINQKMLKHTKLMKSLTWAVLICTLVNLGLFLYQIFSRI
jgi:hypothetical protein